jgi:hypothetical protein
MSDYFEVISTTIVPAQPGFSVARFWRALEKTDHHPGHPACFSYDPVVAWQIIIAKDHGRFERYAIPVTTDHDSFPDWEELVGSQQPIIRRPDGSFDRRGDFHAENEADALKECVEQDAD